MPQTRRTNRASRSAPATPFDVRCTCGERIEGLRREDFQVLTCPSCGGSIYVLGQSPLPTPKPPTKPAAALEEKSLPARRRHTARARARLARRRVRNFALRVFSLRRLFTLPVVVGVAVLAITVSTFVWQWQQHVQVRMSDEADREGRKGLAALAEGDLTSAQKSLSRCASLLDRLKRPISDQHVYLQAAKEVEIVASLPGQPMQVFLRQAADAADHSSVLRDRSFLFDGQLDIGESGRPRPICVGMIGEEPVEVDVADLEILSEHSRYRDDRILFGVKMLSLSKAQGRWRLEVEPASAVWVTHPALLDDLGLSDESIRKTAERQRETLGLPEWTR